MSIKCIVILLKSTSDCFNKELFFSFEQKKNFRKDSFFDALMPVADSLEGGKFEEETIIGKTPQIGQKFQKKK